MNLELRRTRVYDTELVNEIQHICRNLRSNRVNVESVEGYAIVAKVFTNDGIAPSLRGLSSIIGIYVNDNGVTLTDKPTVDDPQSNELIIRRNKV